MPKTSIYDIGLAKTAANYTPLSPVSFLEWAADVYPENTALIHGGIRRTWAQTYARCRQLASALARRGVGKGDTVAIMAPNIPPMFEAHFGPAMLGAVVNTLNTRLDVGNLTYMLDFAEAKVLITDREYSNVVARALEQVDNRPLVIDIDDPEFDGEGKLLGELTYEAFIAQGDPDFQWRLPDDEWNAISLNYTSGTTGKPKGVVYHHRGAYLNAISNIMAWDMPHHAVYLWTLPMFHCNGWCFPWTMAANVGVNICLRQVDPELCLTLIREHGVTHYCGAPVVHSTFINAPEAWREGIDHTVNALVAGAAPPAAMIEGMERIGFNLTHVYGLTETYGPAAMCAKHPEWNKMDVVERAERNARQGVRYPTQQGMTVIDPETMEHLPWDGETMGEVMFRGNITMKGYLKNPQATDKAFAGGWFHTGDLGIVQPDGYVKIKDRSKDIIISGGENISSLEVEDVLSRHPAVLTAAVVAQPDPKWGESPCAFIELREGQTADEAAIIDYCREKLAHFKCPKRVVFGPLPKTSTGKIQKFMLREKAKAE